MERIICGDATTILRTLQEKTCRCCVTSPPYYRLRDYGYTGQIGVEETPEEYITKLVCVFREVRRVLTDDGTLFLNIADTYSGGGRGGHGAKQNSNKGTQSMPRNASALPPKNLIGIPWMLAFALRADGWVLRQEIIWAKPNPMPESVTDRCTKSHESIFLLTKQPRYYFDARAISEPSVKQRTHHEKGQEKNSKTRYGGNKYTNTPDKFCRTKSGNAYAILRRMTGGWDKMRIGESNIAEIIVKNETGEVLAVISDSEIIEKNGVSVAMNEEVE